MMDLRDLILATLCFIVGMSWLRIKELIADIDRDHNAYENWIRGLEARKQDKPEVEKAFNEEYDP